MSRPMKFLVILAFASIFALSVHGCLHLTVNTDLNNFLSDDSEAKF